MKTIDEIRRKLQEAEERRAGTMNNSQRDNLTFPHWNTPVGKRSVLRFLPDANEQNPYFWKENQFINLPFSGVLGQNEHTPVTVRVPCVEMYGEGHVCPILREVRPWWRDESTKQLASTYWVKRNYYMQGFVKSTDLREESPPANPIRRFMMNNQLFAIVKASLLDPEFKSLPIDYFNGVDFNIMATPNGKWTSFTTSNWARSESSLTGDQLDAIDQYGLADLSTYLPTIPSPEAMVAIQEMFTASVNGELYDTERWGQFFKPRGAYNNSGDAPASTAYVPQQRHPVADHVRAQAAVTQAPTPRAQTVEDTGVTTPSNVSTGTPSASELINRIRARNNQ